MNTFYSVIFIIKLILYLLSSVGGDEYCITKLGKYKIDQEWTNEESRKCKCKLLKSTTIEICGPVTIVNKPIKTKAPKQVCRENGFQYNLNESWFSSNQRCTRCKCQPSHQLDGQVKCTNQKHCLNPCEPGQRVLFNRCCEPKCIGKAKINQKPIPCRHHIPPFQTYENKAHFSILRPHKCSDLYCVCSMGRIQCMDHCASSDNKSITTSGSPKPKYPLGKLCCSRIKDYKNITPSHKSSSKSYQSIFIITIIITVIIFVILIFGFVSISRKNRRRLRLKLNSSNQKVLLSDFERNHHLESAVIDNYRENSEQKPPDMYIYDHDDDNRRIV